MKEQSKEQFERIYAENYTRLYYFALNIIGDREASKDIKERIVEKMMSHLRPPTDKILELCYLQQKKYAEVAEMLGISTSSVKKHIIKALRTLRELYGSKDARNRLMDVQYIEVRGER